MGEPALTMGLVRRFGYMLVLLSLLAAIVGRPLQGLAVCTADACVGIVHLVEGCPCDEHACSTAEAEPAHAAMSPLDTCGCEQLDFGFAPLDVVAPDLPTLPNSSRATARILYPFDPALAPPGRVRAFVCLARPPPSRGTLAHLATIRLTI